MRQRAFCCLTRTCADVPNRPVLVPVSRRSPTPSREEIERALARLPRDVRDQRAALASLADSMHREFAASLDHAIVAAAELVDHYGIELGQSFVFDRTGEGIALRNIVRLARVPPGKFSDYPEGGEVVLKISGDPWGEHELETLGAWRKAGLPCVEPAFARKLEVGDRHITCTATVHVPDAIALGDLIKPTSASEAAFIASAVAAFLEPFHDSGARLPSAGHILNNAAIEHFLQVDNALWNVIGLGSGEVTRILRHFAKGSSTDVMLHWDAFPQNILIKKSALKGLDMRHPASWVSKALKRGGLLMDPASNGCIGPREYDIAIACLGAALPVIHFQEATFGHMRDQRSLKEIVEIACSGRRDCSPAFVSFFLGLMLASRGTNRLISALNERFGDPSIVDEVIGARRPDAKRTLWGKLASGPLAVILMSNLVAFRLASEGRDLILTSANEARREQSRLDRPLVLS